MHEIFSPVMKYIEFFFLNVQDVVFQKVFMHPTFPEIDEHNIDCITPVREKTLTLDLSLFRGSVPSAF